MQTTAHGARLQNLNQVAQANSQYLPNALITSSSQGSKPPTSFPSRLRLNALAANFNLSAHPNLIFRTISYNRASAGR